VAVLKHPDNEYEFNQAAQALGITTEAVTVRSVANLSVTLSAWHDDGLVRIVTRTRLSDRDHD
jgi:hypothetical protein